MAAGGDIYCGKSRLRRKFRKLKIENRLKRIERRQKQKAEAFLSHGHDGGNGQDYHINNNNPVDENNIFSNSGNANNNNNHEVENIHCCKFCLQDYGDCDSLYSSGSSESEELQPLIDITPVHSMFKMPFFKKKDKKKEESKSILEPKNADAEVNIEKKADAQPESLVPTPEPEKLPDHARTQETVAYPKQDKDLGNGSVVEQKVENEEISDKENNPYEDERELETTSKKVILQPVMANGMEQITEEKSKEALDEKVFWDDPSESKPDSKTLCCVIM